MVINKFLVFLIAYERNLRCVACTEVTFGKIVLYFKASFTWFDTSTGLSGFK
jgi:hypothetical protein